MSPSKRVFTTQVIEFLGLLIDTLLMIVRIPPNKQCDILQHITNVLGATHHPAGLLQSLAGKLNFIAKAFLLGSHSYRGSMIWQLLSTQSTWYS